ncbi:hypothetical protein CRG98_039505 [Punica granatum]|uniref:Uncharacterized protein n=1 Tax=Punica granatum TaxID=22663 RepID=A0A2I0I8K9_PUNGR|nr:hypothetical protein CRG98_039505 [Punica granatum]
MGKWWLPGRQEHPKTRSPRRERVGEIRGGGGSPTLSLHRSGGDQNLSTLSLRGDLVWGCWPASGATTPYPQSSSSSLRERSKGGGREVSAHTTTLIFFSPPSPLFDCTPLYLQPPLLNRRCSFLPPPSTSITIIFFCFALHHHHHHPHFPSPLSPFELCRCRSSPHLHVATAPIHPELLLPPPNSLRCCSPEAAITTPSPTTVVPLDNPCRARFKEFPGFTWLLPSPCLLLRCCYSRERGSV